MIPPSLIIDPLLIAWLQEDLGRGDRTTDGLELQKMGSGQWVAKAEGIMAGLPIAQRVFQLLNPKIEFIPVVEEGQRVKTGQVVATFNGSLSALLTGERVALNLAMRLSGIATMTRQYTEIIADLPTQLVDTRKTTPGLRILEKYGIRVGGAKNHRMALDDGVMIKDNHIKAAGSIQEAIQRIRPTIPYPLTIEVETTTLEEVKEALMYGADIIMLDNMNLDLMKEAVSYIRGENKQIKIEASGNITLDNIRQVALTGVDYISSSAPITRSTWLDLSMRLD
ncbi:nicotinate-nucleotide pyrophosphorylase [Crocosphaera subtropica ATCC 51142]|uniref:Probable nicotinate-nucleotide pyrophosphorylase [carboxylating] n=1 Tax=Crocosphaera subtropica (strain ATCC 51142 / BH68) TaxID=43989 RepID=B1WSG2_CROS5|nr:carboxylating nicotinate-nucleotide diphosphorylase [Crocosphaera subtropica]ACB51948.1 nicotinate-nucleotide pyrophosphorylase [Crocosphaera subtropica ATCC 51142]